MSNTVTTKATGKIDSRRVSPSARVHKEEGGGERVGHTEEQLPKRWV